MTNDVVGNGEYISRCTGIRSAETVLVLLVYSHAATCPTTYNTTTTNPSHKLATHIFVIMPGNEDRRGSSSSHAHVSIPLEELSTELSTDLATDRTPGRSTAR